MKKIALYGRYPAHHDHPSEILAIVQQNYYDIRHGQELSRNEYIILPWHMHELPGTTWRNVYTTHLTIIQEIRESRCGKPGPDPEQWINAMFSIGLWYNDRFLTLPLDLSMGSVRGIYYLRLLTNAR